LKPFIYLYIIFACAIFSCAKPESTKKSPDFFVGSWQWQYSVLYKYNSTSQLYFIHDTIFSKEELILNVKKSGKIIVFENDTKITSINRNNIGYSVSGKHITYASPDHNLNYMAGNYSFIFMNSFNESDTVLVFGYPYNDEGGSYYNEVAQQNINTEGVIVYNFFTRK
jgi:hypothetical protein